MKAGRRRDGRRAHVRADPGRRVLRRRGRAATVPDPYFGGAGPARTGCIQCGECMTGCRHGAKNTLVKNYLWLAERLGVRGAPADHRDRAARARRRRLARRDGAHRRVGGRRAPGVTVTAAQVVLAAGAYGTQRLLHRMRDTGRLPRLSPRLGELTRTNSESLLGALSRAARRRLHAAASRSRRRSGRRRTPTSSRCATATARTRWGCSRSASPTATGRGRAG